MLHSDFVRTRKAAANPTGSNIRAIWLNTDLSVRVMSTRMTGRTVCLLLVTDKTVKAVAEFVALAPCNINGWWQYLHWLLLSDSLHWCLRNSWKHYDHEQLVLENWNKHGSPWRPWDGRWGTLTKISDTGLSNGLTPFFLKSWYLIDIRCCGPHSRFHFRCHPWH